MTTIPREALTAAHVVLAGRLGRYITHGVPIDLEDTEAALQAALPHLLGPDTADPRHTEGCWRKDIPGPCGCGLRAPDGAFRAPDPGSRDRFEWANWTHRMLVLIQELVSLDDCDRDRKGACHSHLKFSLTPGEQCPHKVARDVLRQWGFCIECGGQYRCTCPASDDSDREDAAETAEHRGDTAR
jgi:hypothetical protein